MADLLVPSEFATIAEAQTFCAPGDRVVLSAGALPHQEAVVLQGGQCGSLEGSGSPTESVLIGVGTEPVLSVRGDPIEIRNLTVRGEGARRCLDADAVPHVGLDGLLFEGCTGAGDGGGARFTNVDNVVVTRTLFTESAATGRGGALAISGAQLVLLASTRIENSQAASGGGVWLNFTTPGNLDLHGLTTCDTRAVAGDGGALLLQGSAGDTNVYLVHDAAFVSGSASAGGGAVYSELGIDVSHVDLLGNVAVTGAAIFGEKGVNVHESIVAASGGQAVDGPGSIGRNNVWFANVGGVGRALDATEVEADPLIYRFVPGVCAANDLRLRPGSPAITGLGDWGWTASPEACGQTPIDRDGDGLCDAVDPCPDDPREWLPPAPPDDGDADGDHVCDAEDVCAGLDDLVDVDVDGVPDCVDGTIDDTGAIGGPNPPGPGDTAEDERGLAAVPGGWFCASSGRGSGWWPALLAVLSARRSGRRRS